MQLAVAVIAKVSLAPFGDEMTNDGDVELLLLLAICCCSFLVAADDVERMDASRAEFKNTEALDEGVIDDVTSSMFCLATMSVCEMH